MKALLSPVFATGAASLTAFFLVIGTLAAGRVAGQAALGPPFEYDLEALGKVPPELILYAEQDPIELGVEKPTAIACGADGTLYVAGDSQVLRRGPDGGAFVARKLTESPHALTVDADGVLWVAFRNRIASLADLAGEPRNLPELASKTFLTSIAVTDDYVYAADAGNRVVWQLTRAGAVVARIGARTTPKSPPHFIVPSPCFDLAIAGDDSLWVTNPGRHAVENYRADASLVTSWSKASMTLDGFCGCCNPSHIALRRDGVFVTSEKGLLRVKLYAPGGDFLGVVAAPADFAPGSEILDLAVDRQNRVCVLDSGHRRIRIFQPKETAP